MSPGAVSPRLASPASLCNLLSTANQVTKNLLLCVCGVTFLPTFVYNYKSLQRVAPIMNMRSEVRKTNSGNSSAQCHIYMVTRGGGGGMRSDIISDNVCSKIYNMLLPNELDF